MQVIKWRITSAALVSALATTLLAIAPVDAQSVVTLERAVRNCRLISEGTARLDCYDGVIDSSTPAAAPAARVEAPLPPPQPQAVIAPPAPAPTPVPTVAAAPAAPPPALAPAPSAAPAPSVAIAPPPARAPAAPKSRSFLGIGGGNPNDKLITVASAEWTPGHKLRVTLNDGTLWEQNDGTEIRNLPPAGVGMLLKKNVFGKHSCKLPAESSFDCEQP